jgi:hypothetical protein
MTALFGESVAAYCPRLTRSTITFRNRRASSFMRPGVPRSLLFTTHRPGRRRSGGEGGHS